MTTLSDLLNQSKKHKLKDLRYCIQIIMESLNTVLINSPCIKEDSFVFYLTDRQIRIYITNTLLAIGCDRYDVKIFTHIGHANSLWIDLKEPVGYSTMLKDTKQVLLECVAYYGSTVDVKNTIRAVKNRCDI